MSLKTPLVHLSTNRVRAKRLLAVIAGLGLAQPALAGDPTVESLPLGSFAWRGSTQTDHAHHDHSLSKSPAGVMGDHAHAAGEWMISINYMRMEMEDSLDGTDSISNDDIFARGFMVTPTEMTMEAWMLGAMYAPTDSVTLMAMIPYKRTSMSHLTGMGGRFDTESEGFGDLKLSALYPISGVGQDTQLNVEAGISIPTGSIDERDATPMSASAKLPYPMQLGSGTYDFHWGLTSTRTFGANSAGVQVKGVMRSGENDEDYRLGNSIEGSAWGSIPVVANTDASLRLKYSQWSDIHGADPELNPNMVPTARGDLRGGKRLDVGVGLKGQVAKAWDISGEVLIPVHQDLDGPQLETTLAYVLSLQVSF